jgi:Zn-finger nucleic acid-binding protein
LNIDYTKRRTCPRCDQIVMMRHFYSPRRRVEVDECPNCGGFWLDAGELALIRNEHANEPEQQRAVKEYLDSVSAAELDPMRSGNSDEVARARRLDQIMNFSRPIKYEHDPL